MPYDIDPVETESGKNERWRHCKKLNFGRLFCANGPFYIY